MASLPLYRFMKRSRKRESGCERRADKGSSGTLLVGERVRELAGSAHRELEAGAYSFAINRAYYALFYAVSALLFEEGCRFTKHSGVRTVFNKEIIKSSRLPRKDGELYNQLFRDRQEGDYIEFTKFDAPYVQEKIVACEDFLTHLRSLIKSLSPGVGEE
jgi:uncharacterized protein